MRFLSGFRQVVRFKQLAGWMGFSALFAATAVLGWFGLGPQPERMVVAPTVRFTAAVAGETRDLDSAALDGALIPLQYRIRRGDTLDRVLLRAGVPESELRQAVDAVGEVLDPRRIRAGEAFYSIVSPGEGLVGIDLPRRGQGVVLAERSGGFWTGRYRPYRRTYVRRALRGEVRGALESSIRGAGGPASLASDMAQVLQWQLDFNRDLRAGDRFEVLYDELLLDGKVERAEAVHALRYRNRDRWLEAYSFPGGADPDADGAAGEGRGRATDDAVAAGDAGPKRYYDRDGQPLERQFLRSPLRYSRVTSRYSLSRFHPILKRRMPHYGVDYGAPTGTPVRATADGTVISAGRRGGGGRTVRVRHANGYMTAYLHLSGYAKGIRSGRRVRQGEVIGYVGSSGLSTGPHLDYRVQHNGKWINPATLSSNPAPPLTADVLPAFLRHRDALLLELRGVRGSVVSAGP